MVPIYPPDKSTLGRTRDGRFAVEQIVSVLTAIKRGQWVIVDGLAQEPQGQVVGQWSAILPSIDSLSLKNDK